MAALESAEGDGRLKQLADGVPNLAWANEGGASVVVVWEIVWIYSDVVGFRVLEEAHGFDVGEALEEGLADAVHAVHDAAVAGENDGKAEVGSRG